MDLEDCARDESLDSSEEENPIWDVPLDNFGSLEDENLCMPEEDMHLNENPDSSEELLDLPTVSEDDTSELRLFLELSETESSDDDSDNEEDLKCPQTGVGTEDGEPTAASWRWYSAMDETLHHSTCPCCLIWSGCCCGLFFLSDYDGILVRDRVYVCRHYFMTAFPDPNPRPQTHYNAALARTRACIEMSFGQLTERFQCLKSLRVACAVLHNIGTLRKLRTPVVEVQPDNDLQPVHLDQPSGRAAWDRIVAQHFS
ncbi:hypothetical protein cypCar_00015204 [Cyprinus carpio]|nr:hypothetical protein cypCar_00015204 [Cyprinus carpio]